MARLVNKLKSVGAEYPTVLWSDSATALCWIKNERVWKQYIGQRVEEIRRLTPKDLWRHCPGELNPADLPSRGLSAKELSDSNTWWNGPSFLYRPETEWPEISQTEPLNEEILQEAVKNVPDVTHLLVTTACDKLNPKVDQIIDIGRFSNVTKLFRVTAYVIKFINKLKNRTLENWREKFEDLTTAELKNAKNLWLQSVQASSFANELAFLTRKDPKLTPPTRVSQFGLFLDDDGIIKCKGRITNAPLSVSTKTAILLPPKHAFTNLTAPWWGGYWERLVRSVKSPIQKTIGRSTLTYDELSTLLTEIEGLINARPLTYVYDDEDSISYHLTPSDLIYGRRVTTTPNSQHFEITSTYDSLTKRLKHHRHLLGQFTRQWRNEYLTSLREHAIKNARLNGDNSVTGVKVGDIVILKNDSVRRSFWKLAKIEELHPGRDGKVRAVSVKVTGTNSSSIQRLRRPIQHVVPLEVKS
ncbi:hypothetical protein ACROYT_G037306 [Oculina patagonica]